MKELASGVDALYLSGAADLPAGLIDRLEAARIAAADSGDPVDVPFGGYVWQLQPFGLHRYRYRLEHQLGLLGITESDHLPTFRFQARAEPLHSPMGPRGVAEWIAAAVRNEDADAVWTVSRVDLHCDVQGWSPRGNDRHRFVCRAKARATYEDNGALTGFTFGKRTSKTINGRLYNKTVEIKGTGHDWWFDVWGDAYERHESVWRLEFEFHRGVLSEMDLRSPTDVLDSVDRLWAYATQSWLTFRQPTDHHCPDRWPLAWQWKRLQNSKLASSAVPMERIAAGQTRGSLRKLMPQLNGRVAAFADLIGVDDPDEACARLPEHLRTYERVSGRSFASRVAERRRRRGR